MGRAEGIAELYERIHVCCACPRTMPSLRARPSVRERLRRCTTADWACVGVLLLILSAGCAGCQWPRSGENWLHGQWVTVSVSSAVVERRKAANRNEPIEKHVMDFRRDGELRRYSPQRGWVQLRVAFRVEGDVVMMRPATEEQFLPLAKRLEDGRLELLMPPRGRFIYKKLKQGVRVEDLDLSGSPAVEKDGGLPGQGGPQAPP